MDTFLSKKLNSEVSSSSRDMVKTGVNNMLSNPADEFNINNAYLMMIAQNMENWRLLKTYGINGKKNCPDYFSQLIVILEIMVDYASVKVPIPEVEKYQKEINSLSVEADSIFYTVDGITYMYTKKSFDMQSRLNKLFRELVFKIDEKGLLTKKSMDAGEAITEIE
jgi:hypothetical protein